MSNNEDLSKLVDLLTEGCNKTERYDKNARLKIEVVHRVVQSNNENERKSVTSAIKEVIICDDKILNELGAVLSAANPRYGSIPKESLNRLLDKLQINVSDPKVVCIAPQTGGSIILSVDEDRLTDEGRPMDEGRLMDESHFRAASVSSASQDSHPPPCDPATEVERTLVTGDQICVRVV